jgi:hypothetical protein
MWFLVLHFAHRNVAAAFDGGWTQSPTLIASRLLLVFVLLSVSLFRRYEN